MPPTQRPVMFKMRTFADDVRRAQGKTESPSEIATAKMMPHEVEQALQEVAHAAVAVPEREVTNASEPKNTIDIRTNTAPEATIVTDRRAKEWSLGSELEKKFTGMWDNMFREPKKTLPKVAPAATRAPVVKAASLESKIAPQDDHRAIEERIRNTKEVKPKIISPILNINTAELEPKWAHYDIDGNSTPNQPSPSLPLLKTENVLKEARPVIKPTFFDSTVPIPLTPQEDIPPIPPPEPPSPPKVPEIPQSEPISVIAPDVIPEPVEEKPAEQPEPVLEVKNTQPEPITNEHIEQAEEISARDTLVERLARTSAGRMPPPVQEKQKLVLAPSGDAKRLTGNIPFVVYAGFAVVVLFFCAVFAGAIMYSLQPTSTEQPIVADAQPLIRPDRIEMIGTPATHLSFMEALTSFSRTASQSEIVEYRVGENESATISPETYVSTAFPTIPSTLRNSLERLFIGTFSGASEPFIILETDSRESALGGILQWEKTLSGDLAPFFGEDIVVVRAQYGTSTAPRQFTDHTLGEQTVRVLHGPDNMPYLIYGIFDEQRIVITKSESTLFAILKLLRESATIEQ